MPGFARSAFRGLLRLDHRSLAEAARGGEADAAAAVPHGSAEAQAGIEQHRVIGRRPGRGRRSLRKGRRHRAYGLYQGDTVARDDHPDRIVIFRDTLLRDFGDDPDELRAQVTRTVRHELAHHLGADELGVRELGL